MGHDKDARGQEATDKKHLHTTLGSKRSSDSEDVGWANTRDLIPHTDLDAEEIPNLFYNSGLIYIYTHQV